MPAAPFPVLFMHIPRTAGFTLKTILSAHFGQERTLLDVHRYDVGSSDLADKAVVEGHVGAAFFTRHFGEDWPDRGLTIIRDPVDRVVSQARHLRQLARPRYHEAMVEQVSDPGRVFDRVPLLSNLQTRLLSGAKVKTNPVLTRSDLDQAKRALQRMALATTESFDLSMALLVAHLGISLPRYHKMNASPATGDEDLRSAEFRAAAEERNALDRELHTFATGLLAAQAEAHVTEVLGFEGVPTPPTHRLSIGSGPGPGGVTLPPHAKQVKVTGWLALAGGPAEAAVIRTAGQAIPLATRVQSSEAAVHFRSADCRLAGIRGIVPVPPEADHLEIIAVDRSRGLRGEIRLPVIRKPAQARPAD